MTEYLFKTYHDVHAYVVVTFGLMAILFNIFTTFVLTRLAMISSVNVLLTCIATSDSLVMLMCIVYLVRWRLVDSPCADSYNWAIFELLYADISITLRGISLWLAVSMAALRWQITKSREPHCRLNTDLSVSYRLIAVCALSVVAMTTPVYLTMSVDLKQLNSTHNNTGCAGPTYSADFSLLSKLNGGFLYKLSFWVNGVFLKLLPCLMLAFYIPLLFKAANYCQRYQGGQRKTRGRTTLILTAILSTTWLCESPNMLMCIICGIAPEYDKIYQNLGDIFDILTLINIISTFILYCTMSKLFRRTVRTTLLKLRCSQHQESIQYSERSLDTFPRDTTLDSIKNYRCLVRERGFAEEKEKSICDSLEHL